MAKLSRFNGLVRAVAGAVAVVSLGGAPSNAAIWHVETEESRLGFVGTQAGTRFDGRFERFDASIHFDPARLADSTVVVVIDMASAKTGDSQRDGALPQPDWFHVSSYPQARFETTAFRRIGDDRYEATARLTIRDVTREVVLPFQLTLDGDRARATGTVEINRTDFGVGQGAWASGQWVGLGVTITVDLTAIRSDGNGRPAR